MTAFATAEDLASYLQLNTVDRYTAELLLELASDAVRAVVGQSVDVVTSTEVYDGLDHGHPWAGTIFLRQVPVVAVSAVVSDGVPVPAADYEWSTRGSITRLSGAFSAAQSGIAVTYTHGWDADTRQWRQARAVALQAAARAYVNPYQLDSLTVGSVSRSWPKDNEGRSGRLELTTFERRSLDDLRR